MSWDISIMQFSRTYRSVAEIAENDKPLALGSRGSVHERVLLEFPGTNWAYPAWGIWDGPAGSLEFNLGNDDPPEGMMLHVRASSEVVNSIVRLCRTNGWQGIDCSSGEFIEQSKEPTRGVESWAAYRDQVVREK
jgi:hypothetical protein